MMVTVMTPGSLALLRRSVGLETLGAVGCGVRPYEKVPLACHVNLFTTLRTISSNGAGRQASTLHAPGRRGAAG